MPGTNLFNLLACPADRGRLQHVGNALACACGRRFRVIDDVPILTLEEDTVVGSFIASTTGLLDDPNFRRMVARREGLLEDATDVEWDIAMAGGFTTFDRLCRLHDYPIPHLDLPALGGVLVDVGSNWGRWACAAGRAGYTVLAIDTQLPACLVGQRIATRLSLPVQFIVADARRLPLRDGSTRVVHSYNVFQYLSESDAARAIAEMRRVLERDGLAVVQVPGRFGAGSLCHQVRRGFRAPSDTEVKYWKPSQLRSVFEAGLGPTRVEMDGLIGLNPRPAPAHSLPVHTRLGVETAGMLRSASRALPLMIWIADSLRVTSHNRRKDPVTAPRRPLGFGGVPRPRVSRESPSAMAPRFGELRRVSSYSIEWAEPGYCLFSRGPYLFRAEAPDASPSLLLEFPASRWMRAVSALRPSQRMLRALFYNVIRLPSREMLLTFGREILLFRRGRFHPLEGLVHRTRVLRGACAVLPNGDVYFGDYLRGPRPTCSRIYRLPAESNRLEIVHEFERGSILHIHGVHRDPYDGSLWAVTGDRVAENRMLRSRDGFASVEVVGEGDETWRCITLRFTATAVYYGTDAEYTQNRLYRLDRRTGVRSTLCALDGPVYYSTAVGPHLFWGVAAEMCPSQHERRGSLWHLHDDRPALVHTFEKDALPWRLFMPGTVEFPLGPGIPGWLLLRGTAFCDFDGPTYALEIDTAAAELTRSPSRAHQVSRAGVRSVISGLPRNEQHLR